MIEACRRYRIPVIFAEFVYVPAKPGKPTGFGLPSSNCLIGPGAERGPNSAETIPELGRRPDDLVVQGHTYDKFYGTPLDLALRSQDIRYLIITGIFTDICVNCTLIAAASRDYRVTAVIDGVATLWPHLQQACFEIWQRKFARLRTTAEVIEEVGAIFHVQRQS